jgi:2-keto-4-pentenoate hydratase/2-oxohepta-3-ene-1,7-dioic acid hydratase in catechol pathway
VRVAARRGPAGPELVLVDGDRTARVPLPPGSPAAGLAATIERLGPLGDWPAPAGGDWEPAAGAWFGPPLEPETIVGVGLNFLPHAADLKAAPTEFPTLFFKGRHTIIGPGDVIPLPAMSRRVTAEAELGLVIGRRMYRVGAADALGYVAGGCCVLDQTAEDVLQMDSRMLTVSKNFPGFFSFGPEVASLDELASPAGGLSGVRVSTCVNGVCARSATLADMRFGPAELLAFISQVMPLECGDIVSTGTPGAVVLSPGDVIECQISGLLPLRNIVGPAGG